MKTITEEEKSIINNYPWWYKDTEWYNETLEHEDLENIKQTALNKLNSYCIEMNVDVNKEYLNVIIDAFNHGKGNLLVQGIAKSLIVGTNCLEYDIVSLANILNFSSLYNDYFKVINVFECFSPEMSLEEVNEKINQMINKIKLNTEYDMILHHTNISNANKIYIQKIIDYVINCLKYDYEISGEIAMNRVEQEANYRYLPQDKLIDSFKLKKEKNKELKRVKN